jgi:DamX protein
MSETPTAGTDLDPLASDRLFGEQLRAMELAAAAPPLAEPSTDPRRALYSRVEGLAAEIAALRVQLRDLEKSLIERIADVDDDRRRAAAQLQRGWQTRRDELDARVRHRARLTLLALGLILVLGAGGIWLLSSQLGALRTRVDVETTRLRAAQQELAAGLGAVRPDRDTAAAGPVSASVPIVGVPPATVLPRVSGTAPAVLPPDLAVGPVVPEPAATTAPAATPPAEGAPARTVRVTDHPFGVQIAAGQSRDKIMELAARPNLPEHVYVYEEARRGRPWYVLLHSLHANTAQAREALTQLPSDWRTRSPWVRVLPVGTSLDLIDAGPTH